MNPLLFGVTLAKEIALKVCSEMSQMLPVQQVSKGQPRPPQLSIEPDAEVVESYPSASLRAGSWQPDVPRSLSEAR